MEYPDLSPLLQQRDLVSATTSALDNGPSTTRPLQRPIDLNIDDPELSDFCSVANFAAASGGQYRITSQTYMRCMAASMYRLTAMRFGPGTGDKAVRLGLLAFAETVFLPWGCLGISYDHLAIRAVRQAK